MLDMRLFIKVGGRDKLVSKAKDGGGFQTVEVMVTNNFEMAVPEWERKDWLELYPSWDYRTLKADGFQCGALMGLILQSNLMAQGILDSVWKQLVTIKKAAEEEAEVTKEILPGGMIKTTDRDGNVITRLPYPDEIKGN